MNQPEVIYENSDFAVIDKPAGFLVHHTHFWAKGERRHSREFEPALTDWVLEKYPETRGVGDLPESRPGLVHRLDKDTSGAMIVARNQSSFLYFKNLFKIGAIKKVYRALVWGRVEPPSGVVDKPIGLTGKTLKRGAGKIDAKKTAPAVTEYKTVKSFGDKFSLLEVVPRTGRTHQIRVHMSVEGYPVVGDKLYGGGRPQIFGRQFLHAYSLEFEAPNGEHLKIEAPLPRDLVQFLEGQVENSS